MVRKYTEKICGRDAEVISMIKPKRLKIGHAVPTGMLPLGIKCEINLAQKTIRLLESATE